MRSLILALLIFSPFVHSMEKITTLNEFYEFAQTYYLSPQPELIDDAILYIEKSEILDKQTALNPVMMTFSCLFSTGTENQKKEWLKLIKKIKPPAKTLLINSFEKTPDNILKLTPISPELNDLNWSCYFITGNTVFIDNLINQVSHINERKDMNLFLTAGTAKWSLSSIAKTDAKVRNTVVNIFKKTENSNLHQHFNDILIKPTNDIKKEMSDIIQLQQASGIW